MLECEDFLYLVSFIGIKSEICVFFGRFFWLVFVTIFIHVFGGSIGVEVSKQFAICTISSFGEMRRRDVRTGVPLFSFVHS